MIIKKHLWRFGSWCVGGFAGGLMVLVPGSAVGGQADETHAPFVLGDTVWEITASPYVDTRDLLVGEAAVIAVSAQGHATLSGAIANVPGSMEGLIKLGDGGLALAGQSTVAGVTRVLQGELTVASDGAIGRGGLQVNAGAALTYAPGVSVSENAQFDAMALAEQPIPPGYAVTLPDSLAPIRWHVHGGQARHAGVLAGRAGFEKTGAGRLVLAHDALGYSGLARVKEGTLAIDELFSGSVQVMTGARLEGIGSVASVWVRDGGTLAPGASIGVLTIPGNLQFDAGATLSLEVAPDGRHDALVVGGQATLAGSVQALAEAGDWQPLTHYRFLTATGGLGGTRFDRVSSNFAFLTPSLSYDASSVTLTLERNDVPVSDVATTPEEAAVGEIVSADEPEVSIVTPDVTQTPAVVPVPLPEVAVVAPDPIVPASPAAVIPESGPDVAAVPDAVVPGRPADQEPEAAPARKDLPLLYDAIVVLDRSDARQALAQLTGVWPTNVRASLLDDSRFVRDAVLDEASNRSADRAGVWASAYQAQGHAAQRAAIPGYVRTLRGLTVGVRHLAHHALAIGGFAGAQQRQSSQRGGPGEGRTTLRSLHAGVDLSWQNEAVQVQTGLAAEWHDARTRRSVQAGRVGQWLHSAWRGRTVQWFGQVTLGPAAMLRPFVQMAVVHQRTPAYAESGGQAALRYADASDIAAYASLGLKAVKAFRTALGAGKIQAEVAWRHGKSRHPVAATASFRDSQAAAPFVVAGRDVSANALTARVMVSTSLGRHGQLSIGYAGLLSRGWVDHGATLRVQHRF